MLFEEVKTEVPLKDLLMLDGDQEENLRLRGLEPPRDEGDDDEISAENLDFMRDF